MLPLVAFRMTTTPLCARGGTVAACETPAPIPIPSKATPAATALAIVRPALHFRSDMISTLFVVNIALLTLVSPIVSVRYLRPSFRDALTVTGEPLRRWQGGCRIARLSPCIDCTFDEHPSRLGHPRTR